MYDADKEAISSTTTDETSKDILRKSFISLVQDQAYLLKLKRFIIDYYVDEVKMRKFRGKNYEKPYTTLNGTKVGSKSERDIADWLYAHNIPFIYEPDIKPKDFPCKPYFYLNTLDTISNMKAN